MHFVECPNVETVTRETFATEVWDKKDGNDFYSSRNLDVVITNLRKKIAGSTIEIETLRGVGLRLVEQ